LQFIGGARVILLAQEHEREVETDGGISGLEIASADELILGLLEVAGFEVSDAEVVTEFRIPRPPGDRLLAEENGVLKLAGIDVLQNLFAGLGGRLGGSQRAEDKNNKDGKQMGCCGFDCVCHRRSCRCRPDGRGRPSSIKPVVSAVVVIVSFLCERSQCAGTPDNGGTMNTDDFLRMFAYDHWANGECLRAMGRGGVASGTVGRMAHILSAEKLWLERIRGERQSMPVWPSSTVEDCIALADEMGSAWRNYLSEVAPGGLEETIEYRNSKGEAWSSRVEDVLTHVLMHSAYHRGQIALEMRAGGMEPAYTDFIHAVRRGMVE